MKNKKRDIKTFELSKGYYEDSFANGNKSHVAEELSELMITSLPAFNSILIELPKEVQKFVLNSSYYQKSNLALSMQAMSFNRIK